MSFTLLATAILPLGADAAPPATVDLRPKTIRTWTIDLPADPFRPVAGSIPVAHAGGDGFKVEAKGIGLAIDTDGDGEVDRDVEGREHPETKIRHARVTLKGVRADGSEFTYPVRLQKAGSGWTWASGSVLTGDVEGVPVKLIDMDGNGSFADVGSDAIAVGSDTAQFLGKSVLLAGDLHALEVDGESLRLAPFEGATGTLDLHSDFDAEGVLLAAVVKSTNGQHSFELSALEDGAPVPAGRYRLVKATLGLGDARVVANTRRMGALRVRADETTSMVWRAPEGELRDRIEGRRPDARPREGALRGRRRRGLDRLGPHRQEPDLQGEGQGDRGRPGGRRAPGPAEATVVPAVVDGVQPSSVDIEMTGQELAFGEVQALPR